MLKMRIIQARDYNEMSRKAANIISAEVILNPRAVLTCNWIYTNRNILTAY